LWFVGGLFLVGVAVGCDETAVAEPRAEPPARSLLDASRNPIDGQENLSTGRLRQGFNNPDEVTLPAGMLARVRAALPNGFELPSAPRRPAISDLRLGSDALPRERSDAVRRRWGEDGYQAWQMTVGRDGGQVGITKLCPPEDPYQANCDPPPNPPPSDPPPPPPPPPPPTITIAWGSFVDPWDSGAYVDFGSFTQASERVASLGVTGFSYIDGYPEAVLHNSRTNTSLVGVGWTYQAWFYGAGFVYEQFGVHDY